MTNKPQSEPTDLPEVIYTAKLSEETREVLEHFGLEAPEKLNKYCIALEDTVLEQVQKRAQSQKEINRLKALLQEHNINYN